MKIVPSGSIVTANEVKQSPRQQKIASGWKSTSLRNDRILRNEVSSQHDGGTHNKQHGEFCENTLLLEMDFRENAIK